MRIQTRDGVDFTNDADEFLGGVTIKGVPLGVRSEYISIASMAGLF